MSAPVGRCVRFLQAARASTPPWGLGRASNRFVGISASNERKAGESLWRFIAPLALTAARSADCHGGLQHFEIDADHAETNMLWRYFL